MTEADLSRKDFEGGGDTAQYLIGLVYLTGSVSDRFGI